MNPPTVYPFAHYELIHLSHVRKEQSLEAFKAKRQLTEKDGPHGVYFQGDKTLMKGEVVPQTYDCIRLPLDSFVIEIDGWSPPSSVSPDEHVWIPLPCFHSTPIRLTKDIATPTYGSFANPQDRERVATAVYDMLDLGIHASLRHRLQPMPQQIYGLYQRLQMPNGSFRWFRK